MHLNIFAADVKHRRHFQDKQNSGRIRVNYLEWQVIISNLQGISVSEGFLYHSKHSRPDKKSYVMHYLIWVYTVSQDTHLQVSV